jgi:hypothetical protein
MKNSLKFFALLGIITCFSGCEVTFTEPVYTIEETPPPTYTNLEATIISESPVLQTAIASAAQHTYTPEEVEIAYQTAMTKIAEFTPNPTNTPSFGIFDSGVYFEMNLPRGISVKNVWQGQVNNQIVRIYAGKTFPDPRLGPNQEIMDFGLLVLRVYEPNNHLPIVIERYTTTDEVGHIQIENIEGTRLTLTASNYLSSANTPIPFYFDVVARQFEGIAGGLTFPEPTPAADSYP